MMVSIKKISSLEKVRILILYQQNYSANHISKKLDRDLSTVLRVLNAAGVPLRSQSEQTRLSLGNKYQYLDEIIELYFSADQPSMTKIVETLQERHPGEDTPTQGWISYTLKNVNIRARTRGETRRGKPIYTKFEQEIVDLYKAGVYAKDIAKMLKDRYWNGLPGHRSNVPSAWTILNYLKRLGVPVVKYDGKRDINPAILNEYAGADE